MKNSNSLLFETPQRPRMSTIDGIEFDGTILPSPVDSRSFSPTTTVRSGSSATLHVHQDIQPPDLSTFRLLMTHFGAALALFLATTDATIVSTSLPTIASDLNATQTQYTWVGVAYMLTQTALQPFYGKVSDLVGRKNVLFSSMTIFAIGSLLCGVAKGITWLIAARALAGIGGGGIVSSVWVITAELVEVRRRAKWSQVLSLTWSCSAIAGPLLGGVFSSGSGSSLLSWRWGFYLNLPVCLVGFLVIFASLRGVHLSRTCDVSWRTLARSFDFGGLVMFMGGTSCIILGFSFATDNGWAVPSTLILIILGLLVLACGGFYEARTSRQCLFPPSMFKNRTAVTILFVTFLHNFSFTAGTFYLALYFQAANGCSPLQAGIKVLPYALGSSLASMPAAWFIGCWQRRTKNTSGQNLIISIGLATSTLGFGLLTLLNEHSSVAAQVFFPLIAGIGLGMLFHAPYQVFGQALKPQELATGTSAFFLVRFTGATVGLAVAGAIFYARLSNRLPTGLPLDQSGASVDYSLIRSIEPLVLRDQVLRVVSSSIQTVWIVCSPCLGLAFLLSFFLRKLPIQDGPDATKEVHKAKNPSETTA
ncbi:hypothetical protein E4T56_gene3559 [Termitomyces sp. T112]|nr:hypothetical protein E4T56_gene3559 [Termitomyces sp. T112]